MYPASCICAAPASADRVVDAGAPTIAGAPSCRPVSALVQRCRSVRSQAPESSKSLTDHMASSGDGPRKADAGRPLPICTAWNAVPASRSPRVRSSQPERTDDPGAARSISSIASKCDRVGFAMPTAWTAPNVPASHHGINGCIAGCIPNIGSSGSRAFCGIPIVRPHLGVPRISSRHDRVETVEATAQREHHEHVAGVRLGGERHLGREPSRGEPGERAYRAKPSEERSPGDARSRGNRTAEQMSSS